MNRRKLGVIITYLYNFTLIGVNFLYVPLLLNGLGKQEYGLYQLVGAVIAYINIFEITFSSSLVKFYCKYKATDDLEKMENTLAIGQKVFKLLSIVLLILYFIFSALFGRIYNMSLSPIEINEGKIILFISIINLIIEMNGYSHLSAITAYERFLFIKVLAIFTTLIKPIVIILVIKHFPYAVSVVIVQCIINVIAIWIRKIYARKVLQVKIKFHYMDKKLLHEMLLFTGSLLFGVIADRIFWQTDQLILGKLYGTSVVTIYSIGMQICNCYGPLGTSISSVFMPRVSFMKENGANIEEFSALFEKIGYITYVILFLVLSGFCVFGKIFINLWAGPGFDLAYWIAIIIMIPFTIDLVENIGLTILQVFDKYSFRAKMYFGSAILNIIFTIILTAWIGMIGSALSTGITMFITSGIIMNIYYNRVMGIKVEKLIKKCIVLSVKSIIPIGIGILYIRVFSVKSWQILLLGIGIYCITYLVVCIPRTLLKEILKK